MLQQQRYSTRAKFWHLINRCAIIIIISFFVIFLLHPALFQTSALFSKSRPKIPLRTQGQFKAIGT